MADNKMKRNLEFRMSKKVAELTQVVHMLFTRNHEKEVEVDALKEVYEHEISLAIGDAKDKINVLDGKVQELERKLEREKEKHTTAVEETVARENSDIEDEWRRRLVASEKSLNEEKLETQHMRDLLINAQKDIENLRQKLEDTLLTKNFEIKRRDVELEKYRKQVHELERTIHEADTRSNEAVKNLEKQNDELQSELVEMQGLLEETHRVKEHLLSRVKQLENELKTLKKDFQKKISEVIQQNHMVKVPDSTPVQHNFTEYHDELEKLRAEVRRYRLELFNRDNNFNRVFTDQNPIIVDPKAGRIGVHSGNVIHQSLNSAHTQISSLAMQGRERTFSYDMLHGYNEETRRPNSRVSTASGGRFPVLSRDQKDRITKLMKPRPLPKEMLFSK